MTESNIIRVLLVDDHSVVRTGLRFFVLAFEDLELVGEAASGEQAISLCDEAQPDVVLMDLVMPGLDGVCATQIIRERCPNTQVIALTSFAEEHLVGKALEAGAIGYLLKDVSADELADAIRAAHAGRPTLATEATQALIQATTQPRGPCYDLTPRETEVLALMIEGLSNPAIAERLVIGLSTVKFHVSNIFSKLGVTSRAEAIALAWQHQLVTRPKENNLSH
jgi:NarL family two-component system response regulator LiaR